MPSYPYPKTPNGVAGRRAFLVYGGTIMKRIFPFLFSFLVLCLTGCTAAAEAGYTQIDQETAKEMMAIMHFALPSGQWCVCQWTLGAMNGQT